MSRKHSLLEDFRILALIGVLAGALGGLAIGVVTNRPASSAATSSAAH
jgi:hypothetical protein